MIYYELDPITNEISNLSDSTAKIEDDFSINSRIEKIAQSNKPSDVVFYCSRFKKEKYSNKKFDDENRENSINQTDLIYDENDIIKIIQSLNEAKENLEFEKEIDSVINFFLMKEINPSKIENKMTPNLRLLKADPLFRSYVDAKLLKYKPIKFDLINFYISKHDIGIQSPEFLSKKSKNLKKLNKNSVDINKKYSFLQQKNSSKTKSFNKTNDYKYYTPQKKQSFIFLSESDTENINKSQDYDQNERLSNDIETNEIPHHYKDSDSIKSKVSENDYYSTFYSSDIYSCSNYYSETQGESTKIEEQKRRNRHRHHKHHHSKNVKNSKHHHSHHNKSNLSPSDKLIEIEQESSSELKEIRKNKQNKPELLHLDIEDSLNMIIESSSTQNSVSNDDKQLQKDDKNPSDLSIKDEDCFEIEFENEIEEEDVVE